MNVVLVTRRQAVARLLCVPGLAAGFVGVPARAEASAPAAAEAETIGRMRKLHEQRKWKELVAQFQGQDFAGWPNPGEAFHLRGQAYASLKDAVHAEQDLKTAIARSPQNAYIWYSLGEVYRELVRDDARALESYAKAFALAGKSASWMPISATLHSADILLHQLKTDAAMEVLKRYGEEDLRKLPPIWRVQALRAHGRVLAAQGREQEALARFKEALDLDRRQ